MMNSTVPQGSLVTPGQPQFSSLKTASCEGGGRVCSQDNSKDGVKRAWNVSNLQVSEIGIEPAVSKHGSDTHLEVRLITLFVETEFALCYL